MRTNTKTSTKFIDTMASDGWNINFTYETENGVLSPKIEAQGTKGTTMVSVFKEAAMTQVIFNNGSHDSAVVSVIMAELDVIASEHTHDPEPPSE